MRKRIAEGGLAAIEASQDPLIRLARLVAQDKSISDLESQGVPRTTVLNAPVVTADNVDQYIDLAFESS